MMSRFDAVLFDVGGVLTIPDPVVTGDALEPWIGTGIPFHRFRRAHHRALHALEAPVLDAGGDASVETMDWNIFRRAYAAALGVPDAALDDAVSALNRVWTPLFWRARVEESIAAMWRLHLAGVPMGIISNAAGQVPAMLATQGVCQVGEGAGVPVAFVLDSTLVGVAKPDPAIFRMGLAGLGDVEPARVAYIGDSVINDVFGAASAGLTPLHLDPFDVYAAYDHERIHSVHDVIGMCTGEAQPRMH